MVWRAADTAEMPAPFRLDIFLLLVAGCAHPVR